MAQQFNVADVVGQFSAGQRAELGRQAQVQQAEQSQFTTDQARKLAPLNEQKIKLGIERSQQQLSETDRRAAFERNIQTAVELKSLPNEQKAAFLTKRISEGVAAGRDMTQTEQALELVNTGRFDELAQGGDQLIQVGERFGVIKTAAQLGTVIKPTASKQDFDTFKLLNERAAKTQDPVDIKLAKQFGVQAGFDRLSPQELADIDVQKESKKTLVKQAATASKEAFDSLKGVRKTVANIDDAIKALDKGAETGPIISKLPSFRQAAIELDNIKGRMGLDVVGSTTFGALSESELAFALNVALPDSLEPAALKDWLIRKKDSQTKLANELRKAASFLGTPGNTIADYIAQQEKENPSVENLSDEDLFN